jgi:hypothetical protein
VYDESRHEVSNKGPLRYSEETGGFDFESHASVESDSIHSFHPRHRDDPGAYFFAIRIHCPYNYAMPPEEPEEFELDPDIPASSYEPALEESETDIPDIPEELDVKEKTWQ